MSLAGLVTTRSYYSDALSTNEAEYHFVLINKLFNRQVCFKSKPGQATTLEVKPQETLKELMQQIHQELSGKMFKN